MSDPFMSRWAGVLGVLASVLIVLSAAARLGIGLLHDVDPATMTHTLTYGLALLGMCALLLALTAIYALEPSRFGRLGLVGYLFAFVGTTLVAGDWWFEAFVVPSIATEAPHVLELPPGGSVLAGAIATVGLYSVGWLLFGLAVFRAATTRRTAAAFVITGGVLGPLALTAPYQIPLAVGIGWIGYGLIRAPGAPLRLPAEDDLPLQSPVRSV
jgi:hypothetical protein